MANKKYTAKDVSKIIFKIHGDKILLDENTYKNTHTKARFVDKDYGEWWAYPNDILRGGEHLLRSQDNKKLSTEQIIKKLKKNNEFVIGIKPETYIGSNKKAAFVDKDYGVFWARVSRVLVGQAAHPKRRKSLVLSIKTVVNRIKDLFGDEIRIVEETYQGVAKKAKFIDKDFGIFEKSVSDVLNGHGCKSRWDVSRSARSPKRKNINDVEKIAKINEIVVISKEYTNNKTKLNFRCKLGHEFWMNFNDLQSGHGCPFCKNKSENNLLDMIENILPEVYGLKRHYSPDFLGRQHVDGAICKNGLLICGIEYDGMQHFEPIKAWGGEKKLKENKKSDRKKNKKFKDNNIPLIRFSYDEEITKELVLKRLKEAKIL